MMTLEDVMFAVAFVCVTVSPIALLFMYVEMVDIKWWRDYYKRELGHYKTLCFQRDKPEEDEEVTWR